MVQLGNGALTYKQTEPTEPIIPKGHRIMATPTQFVAQLTPLAGAALAGWYWLYAATRQNPSPYLEEVSTIGLLFVVLTIGLVGSGIAAYVSLVVFVTIGSLIVKVTRASPKFVASSRDWFATKVRRGR